MKYLSSKVHRNITLFFNIDNYKCF